MLLTKRMLKDCYQVTIRRSDGTEYPAMRHTRDWWDGVPCISRELPGGDWTTGALGPGETIAPMGQPSGLEGPGTRPGNGGA